MASMWRRAMHYLGLGPDDEYDDYDDYDVTGEHQRPLATRPPTRYTSAPGVPRPVGEPRSSVRTLPPTFGDEPHANGTANGNGAARAAREGHDRPAYTSARSAAAAHADRPPERAQDRDRDRGDRDRADRDRSDRDRLDRLGDRGSERSGPPSSSRPRPAVVRPLVPATPKPHVVAPGSFNDAQEIADKFKGSVPVILNLQGVERDLARRIIDFASGLCYALDGQMERVANQVYLLTPTDVEVSPEERRRLQERGYEA